VATKTYQTMPAATKKYQTITAGVSIEGRSQIGNFGSVAIKGPNLTN